MKGGAGILSGFILVLAPAFLYAQNAGSGGSLSLEEALRVLGGNAELRWDPLFRTGSFSAGGRVAAFGTGRAGEQGPVMVDGRDILTLPLPYTEQGLLRFPEAFVGALGTALGRPRGGESPPFRIAAIIVDPGHGGKDSGAASTHTIDGKTLRLVEKDLTLRVSRELHSRLAAAYPDKRVLMTRTGDTLPSLEDRVNFAHSIPLEENEAIIYISVHANASFNTTARGYEVWYLSPEYRRTVIDTDRYGGQEDLMAVINTMLEEEYTTESILLAQSILKSFDETLGSLLPSRGIKAEEWFVVRNVRMPSVLVELAFVSNPQDARLLSEDTHLRKFSDALYKGIAGFISQFERSGGFTAVQ